MDWKSLLAGALGCVMLVSHGETPRALRVGIAGHAFDHLGTIGDQAETAIASGATILYATGLGADGYSGLPAKEVLRTHEAAVRAYNARAKAAGTSHMLGYLCATSLVGLESFDRHWSGDFRAAFKTPPSEWRQQGTNGQPLRSWYGGAYEPACMNHPDWREYERRLVGCNWKQDTTAFSSTTPQCIRRAATARIACRDFTGFFASRAEHPWIHP